MVATGNRDGTEGSGALLAIYISFAGTNNAIAGRSARSFTWEGRFDAMAENVASGDYIVMEFGHKDGDFLTPTDNGRSDCTPMDDNYSKTCTTTYNSVEETVMPYYTYLINAAHQFQAKGTKVIISSATPNNVWETGTFTYCVPICDLCQRRRSRHRSNICGSWIVYCGVVDVRRPETVHSYYPNDHTHTSPEDANVVARAFIFGLEATNSSLVDFVTSD